jgi:hypothetical protein
MQHVIDAARLIASSASQGIPMPRANPSADWATLATEAALLWADASVVMAMRSWRMMGGGAAANREMERMVSEKVEAGIELAGALAAGRVTSPNAAARKVISVYGRRVRENRRRLG